MEDGVRADRVGVMEIHQRPGDDVAVGRGVQPARAQFRPIDDRGQRRPRHRGRRPHDREGLLLADIRVVGGNGSDRVGARVGGGGGRRTVGHTRIVRADVGVDESGHLGVERGGRVGLGCVVIHQARRGRQGDRGDHLQSRDRCARRRVGAVQRRAGLVHRREDEPGIPLAGLVLRVIGERHVVVAVVGDRPGRIADVVAAGGILHLGQQAAAGVRKEAALEILLRAEDEVGGQVDVEGQRVGRGQVAAERRGSGQPDDIVHRIHRRGVVRVEAEKLKCEVQPARRIDRRGGQDPRAVPGFHQASAAQRADPAGTAQRRVRRHVHLPAGGQRAVHHQLAGVHRRRPGVGARPGKDRRPQPLLREAARAGDPGPEFGEARAAHRQAPCPQLHLAVDRVEGGELLVLSVQVQDRVAAGEDQGGGGVKGAARSQPQGSAGDLHVTREGVGGADHRCAGVPLP